MKNLTLMQELKPQLEEEGFAVFYKEANKDTAVDQLIVPIAKEDGTALNLEINTIDDPQGIYPVTEFVQCFIAIPIQINNEKTVEIYTLLNKINIELPMGGFYLHEAGIVFYKYTIVVHDNDREKILARLMDSIDISNHLFQNFESLIVEFISA